MYLPYVRLIISLLSIVLKYSSNSRLRRIYDLLYSIGSSINDTITKERGAIKYTLFENILAIVIRNLGSTIIKRDIKVTFQIVLITNS